MKDVLAVFCKKKPKRVSDYKYFIIKNICNDNPLAFFFQKFIQFRITKNCKSVNNLNKKIYIIYKWKQIILLFLNVKYVIFLQKIDVIIKHIYPQKNI
tara:strand:+ start:80 stop:373 length:294 start_codon:yes stop_codon:yes gene_type:complete